MDISAFPHMTTILNALALIGGLSLLAILVSICIFGRALSRLGRDLGEDREGGGE